MLTFIIGASQRGKSTLARALGASDDRAVVSAGRWARDLSGVREHGDEAAARIAEVSLAALRSDPLVAAKVIEASVGALRDAIVEGCRNPTDVLHLARPGDHVIDVGGEGVLGWERDGLAAIRACRWHLASLGVTWSDYRRHFATLPSPLVAAARSHLLYGDDRAGVDRGRIVALESYEGDPVTACWMSAGGGMFHDLPLEGFVGDCMGLDPEDAVLYLDAHPSPVAGDPCYSPAGPGSPIVELPPASGEVAVFGRDRVRVGTGVVRVTIHWPEGNLLLHLVDLNGRLLLWPPHKILWDPAARALPEWRKLRR